MPARQPKLLALAGKARSGKTTAANILKAKGWTVLSFATPLRQATEKVWIAPKIDGSGNSMIVCSYLAVDVLDWFGLTFALKHSGRLAEAICNWLVFDVTDKTEAQLKEAFRPVLIETGKMLRKHAHDDGGDDVMLEIMESNIKKHHEAGHDVVIDDLRFRQEVSMLKEYGATIVRMVRSQSLQIDDVSEKELDKAKIFELTNDGTIEELENKLETCFGEVEYRRFHKQFPFDEMPRL